MNEQSIPKLYWHQEEKRGPMLGLCVYEDRYFLVFQILPVASESGDLWRVAIGPATLMGVMERLCPDCEKYWRLHWREFIERTAPIGVRLIGGRVK